MLGLVSRDFARYGPATECFRASLRLDGSYVSNRFAYTALAAILRRSGHPTDLQNARYHARRVTQENPDDVYAESLFAAIESDLRRFVRFRR